jgi:hypothetical protein
MSTFVRPRTICPVVLCLLLFVSLPASAKSVSVTGAGYIGGTADGLGVNGGIFSCFSAAPDGPSNLGNGMVGVPMSLSFGPIAYSGPGFTEVNVGNQFTDILTGGILFTAPTFTVPASALFTGTFTTTVDFSGQLTAYRDVNGSLGPLMAVLSFSGVGTATLKLQDNGLGSFTIISAEGDFTNASGTLTTVPEPPSFALMGAGLLVLATAAANRARRRRRVPILDVLCHGWDSTNVSRLGCP